MTDCIKEIMEAAGGLLDKREAAELLRKFNNASKNMSPETRSAALDILLAEASERMMRMNELDGIFNKRSELSHKISVDRAVSKMNNLPGNLRQKFKASFVGRPGQRDGFIHAVEGVRAQFETLLLGRLQEQGLLAHWHDPETLSSAIHVAFSPSAKVTSKEAQAIGNILREVNKFSIARANKAGSYVLDTPRYLFTSKVADSAKVRDLGKTAFVDFVQSLNLDTRVFEGMDSKEIDKYFGDLYDRLASGDQYRAPTGTFDGIGGLTKDRFANLAKKNSLDMDVPFADAESFLKFHEQLSSDPLASAVARRVDQIGRSIGMMEAFGPSPDRWLEDVVSAFRNEMSPEDQAYFEGGIPIRNTGKTTILTAPLDILKDWYLYAPPKAVIDELLGAASNPASPSFAAIGQGVRNWSAMAALGGGLFSQLMDVAPRIAMLNKYGNGFEALIHPFTQFGELFPAAEKSLFYTRMGLAAETMVHTLAENATGGVGMSRWMNRYFKLNGMYWADTLGKRFTVNYLSRSLGDALASGRMTDPIVNLFESYGFAKEDFKKFASALGDVQGVGKVVDPEKLRGIDVKLHAKFLGAFNDYVKTATPTGGAWERAATHKGLRPGTVGGETLRTINMFRSYPSMLLSKVYPAILYDHGPGGIFATALGMMTMYYIGDSMRQIAAGRTPKDMSNPENVLKVLTASGLGGIYSDLLLHDYSANGVSLADTLGGPALGKLGELAEIPSYGTGLTLDVLTGQQTPGEAAGKFGVKTARTTLQSLPNILVTRTILEHTILYGIMEMSDPGSVDQIYSRLKERTGQERLF